MSVGIRVLGLVLLGLGIAFLIWGMNESDALANRFMREMSGKYPEETKRYIMGGITLIIVGVGILCADFFRKKS